MRCEVCGNDYDKAFRLVDAEGSEHIFDSLECAIHRIAPTCRHCGCRIVGHGIEASGSLFCCAHCAQASGVHEARDRVESSADGPDAGAPDTNEEELRRAAVALDEPSG